jgi:hypothetical protein
LLPKSIEKGRALFGVFLPRHDLVPVIDTFDRNQASPFSFFG